MVHITSLPSDYYHYEEAHHRLIGERTRQTFCLGDELTVQVASVNLDERKVDFELIAAHQPKPSSAKRESVRDKLRRGDFSGLDTKSSGSKKAGAQTKNSRKKITIPKNANQKSGQEKSGYE